MAELIKIVQPNSNIMVEETTNFTTLELDNEYTKIKTVIESEDWKLSYKENFKEYYDKILLKEDFGLVAFGVIAIGAIISKLIYWIKSKYTLTVKKLLTQSKELNDIYTKVEYLLAHDKMARFKHRNDRIDAEVHYAVMIDKKDPTKVYKLYLDNLAYNPDYYIKQVQDIMRYASSKKNDNDRIEAINTMIDSLIANEEKYIAQNNGYIYSCDPFMKIEKYTNQRLEEVLMVYKEYIENIYYVIDIYNKNISAQLAYLQLLDTAYKKMLSDYGKDKEGRDAIDRLFKYLIKNATASMDFNTKSMVIYNDMIKFYSDELHKIYDIIKS